MILRWHVQFTFCSKKATTKHVDNKAVSQGCKPWMYHRIKDITHLVHHLTYWHPCP